MRIFRYIKDIFKPDQEHMIAQQQAYKLNQKKLAFYVGFIAICLPALLLFSRYIGIEARDTISSYFYVPLFGGIFVISIAFIGTFLIGYKGKNRWENHLATFAGFCAFGIALFPTNNHGLIDFKDQLHLYVTATKKGESLIINPPIKITEAFTLNQYADGLHLCFTIVFFGFLAFYTLFIFTRSEEGVSKIDGKFTQTKIIRNTIYIFSGCMMLLFMLVLWLEYVPPFICSNWNKCNLTLVFESLVLIFFGLTWLIKSRFFDMLLKDKDEDGKVKLQTSD